MRALILIGFVLTVIVLIPLALIYSINTLFDLSNPYDFQHWLAAFIVIAIAQGNRKIVERKAETQ